MAVETRFLPGERDGEAALRRQSSWIARMPLVATVLDGVPDPVFVLNRRRQIIFANREARETLSTEREGLIGRRPGEALGCANAAREPGGCGTSEHCTTCGIGRAIAGLRAETVTEEARIPAGPGARDAEFKASVTPFESHGERFILLALRDQSEEHRRRALERVFFHDLLNTAGGLLNVADLFPVAPPADRPELMRVLGRLSQRLVDEIVGQRDLAAVERGEFRVEPEEFDLRAELEDVAEVYRRHRVGANKVLRVEAGPAAPLRLDRRLLGRVLGNLVKNALEAESAGALVRVGWRETGGGLCVWVANPAVMPRAVQLQVFQRSFSTKGAGRGLGTYGAKLIAERYLGGSVDFTSLPGLGTEFRLTLPKKVG